MWRHVAHTSLSHTSLSHKSLTRVARTNRSHKSLTQVSHTSLSHKSLAQVAHTSLSHKSLAQVSHTSLSHKSLAQVSRTRLSHKSPTFFQMLFPHVTLPFPLYIYISAESSSRLLHGQVCRALHAQGHTIIIATARRMRTHKGNVPAVVADIGEITLRQLREMGIPHDEISFGKPWAQFYVDDLAVNAHRDLHKEIGFYPQSPLCDDSVALSPPRPRLPLAELPPTSTRKIDMLLAASAGLGLGLLMGMVRTAK